jgi:predicted N-formylglutamate amidohydrolase
MIEICEIIGRRQQGSILIIGDHASNHIPPEIDLNIGLNCLQTHIAWDIGVSGVARLLTRRPGFTAALACNSSLVVDLNREPADKSVIPAQSDGVCLSGNLIGDAEREMRLNKYYHPYHAGISALIDEVRPSLLLSLHSFTPQLAGQDAQSRPWHAGILYNDDDRAARIAVPALTQAGLNVGDQLPYSGKDLNATMNRHGEARGIAYLGVEMRQDLITDTDGQARFASILAAVCKEVTEILGLTRQIE